MIGPGPSGNQRFKISHRFAPDMPSWESDEGIGEFLSLQKSMKNGSVANFSEMKLPIHTGTHVDAPGHAFDHYFEMNNCLLKNINGEGKERNFLLMCL